MASASCVFCRGLGLRKTERKGEERPCGCVFRAIFRACFSRYRYCLETTGRLRPTAMEMVPGPRGWKYYGRKYEEFIADFEIIARRTLTDIEQKVFHWYFQQGCDWKVCTAKIGINRAKLFYTAYAVQEKLGRAFRETQPYGLFPLDEYFQQTTIGKRPSFRVAEEGAYPLDNLVEMPQRPAAQVAPQPAGEERKAVVVQWPQQRLRRAA
ncbi:MAG: hypothetical protein NW208_07510 [Bryobacter sp.]|nr:hypothetical protein [Bryobacter sp.]